MDVWRWELSINPQEFGTCHHSPGSSTASALAMPMMHPAYINAPNIASKKMRHSLAAMLEAVNHHLTCPLLKASLSTAPLPAYLTELQIR